MFHFVFIGSSLLGKISTIGCLLPIAELAIAWPEMKGRNRRKALDPVGVNGHVHCIDVIMTTMVSQVTSLTFVYSTVYSDADQRKHQSSASLALCVGNSPGPVNSPLKGPVMRKMFPFDDVIMQQPWLCYGNPLTHWGRVTHICVGKLTITGSDSDLSPGRRQVIIWTGAGILFIWPLGTNFPKSETLIETQRSSFKKMHSKTPSAKCCPFCLALNVLMTGSSYITS